MIAIFSLFLLTACGEKDYTRAELDLRGPLGDSTNTDIFDFFIDYIKKESHLTRAQAIKANEGEEELHRLVAAGELLKSQIASVYEGEMSHVLYIFCSHYKDCKSFSLYAKNGQVVAAGSKEDFFTDLIIKNEVYNQFIDGKLTEPYFEDQDKKITYPVFMHERDFGVHKKSKEASELIGFVVVHKK